jgi:hypothetical protein
MMILKAGVPVQTKSGVRVELLPTGERTIDPRW